MTAPDPISGRELAAFVAAVEAGTLQAAADALGLTQSAISKRIQSLELRTGVTLLDRGRLGAQPTEIGRALYPEARYALDALASVALVTSRATADRAHVLRIAASHTVGEFLMPGWLAAFRAEVAAPALYYCEVDIANSPSVIERLRASDAEIGFVEGIDRVDDLESLVLARDRLVVVVAAGHRWSRRESISPAQLATEDYFTRESDSGTRAVAAVALARRGVELEPALATPSIEGLKRAVLGGGFTVLSSIAVERDVAAGVLRTIKVRGVDLERELRAVRAGPPARRSAAHRLWSWLGSAVAAPMESIQSRTEWYAARRARMMVR